ncbi:MULTISPECIES: hypothetical protein [Nocardia]|nr:MULTISPECIES: hypothetical protein [Nocardia]
MSLGNAFTLDSDSELLSRRTYGALGITAYLTRQDSPQLACDHIPGRVIT